MRDTGYLEMEMVPLFNFLVMYFKKPIQLRLSVIFQICP